MRKTRGFTLLEVLIALAILALSTAAVLRQTQLGVQQQKRLELKSYAMWIADDEMSGITAQKGLPPLGRREHRITLHEVEWEVATDVQTTPDADMYKVIVSVAIATARDNPLVTFTTYQGRY